MDVIITVLDTSVCTENLGDFVIMDAVRGQLSDVFPTAMFLHTTTHDKISRPSYNLVKKSHFSFVGGTNLLSSNMNRYNQWKVGVKDSFFLKDIVLMGVGWWQYQKEPNRYTAFILNSILHRTILHSVRDSFTEKMMRAAGFGNVINTGCPTMWKLDKRHCADIPQRKGDKAVTTLTDYRKDPVSDLAFIKILKKMYKKVFIWPQGSGDLSYIEKLGVGSVCDVIAPNIEAYDEILDREYSVDYVGTRLHAGVRALQKKRRSIILGVDNRAFEKSSDFNIQVCSRENTEEIAYTVERDFVTDIKLPTENIRRWKSQFV